MTSHCVQQIKHYCFLICLQPSQRACKSPAGGKCGGEVVPGLIMHSHTSSAPLTKWEWSHRYHILQVVDMLLFSNTLHLKWDTVRFNMKEQMDELISKVIYLKLWWERLVGLRSQIGTTHVAIPQIRCWVEFQVFWRISSKCLFLKYLSFRKCISNANSLQFIHVCKLH